MDSDAVVTTVKGLPVRVADVIAHLKVKGIFRTAIFEIIERRVIQLKIEEFGIPVPEDLVQRRILERRMLAGLQDDQAFQKYLRFFGITEQQWQESVRIEILRDLLKEHVVSRRQIQDFYKQEAERFTSAALARIACRTRAEAEAALAAARTGEKDFVELARQYSVDESTRYGGGYIGNVKPGMLSSEVDQAVFSAAPEDVIGPFRENTLWTVYKIYNVTTERLSEPVRRQICEMIFEQWLRQQVCTVPA